MGVITTRAQKIHKIRRTGRFLIIGLALLCLVSITFIPVAYAADEVTVTFKAAQEITGNGLSSPSVNKTVTYRMTPKTAGAPMPVGSSQDGYTFTITGSTEAQIGPITFTAPGQYIYELNNITEDNKDFTYDRQVYTIEIYIARDLTESVVIIKKGNDKATLLYKHVYTGPTVNTPDTWIWKTVFNSDISAPPPTVFYFQLKALSPSNPMPNGSVGDVKIVEREGSGQATFGTWTYTEEGIYYYEVSEVVYSKVSGYTYDITVYKITDTVKAVGDKLELTRVVINPSGANYETMMFLNSYKSGGVETVDKQKPKPTPTPTPTPTPQIVSPPNTVNPEDPEYDPNLPPIPGEGGDWTANDDPPVVAGIITGVPKTGDDSQIIPNFIFFCISGVMAIGTVIYLLVGRKREKMMK